MKNIIIILTFLTFIAQSFAASISAKFDAEAVRPDETATYTITFTGVSGRISLRDIPIPSGLRVVGQSNSSYNINGEISSAIGLSMVAESEGTYTIPAWKITLQGNTYDIPAATVKFDKDAPEREDQSRGFGNMGNITIRSTFPTMSMRQNAQRQRQEVQHSYEDTLRKNSSLKLEIERKKIYVGETVPCRLVFSCDKKLYENGFKLAQLVPQIKKADDFDCPAFNGKPDVDASTDPDKIIISYSTVITPLKVGTYDLDFSAQGVFVREIGMDELINMSFFERAMNMGGASQIPFETNMEAVKIEVLPLPEEGKPASFEGAIGTFSLEQITAEPDALTVGEPCIITAKLVGMGNFARVGTPSLDTRGEWKSYKPKSSFVDESNGLGYIGIKTFTFTAVPQKADLAKTPQVIFSFFNPLSGKYEELKSDSVQVSVAPTGRSKRIETKSDEVSAPPFSKISENISPRTEFGKSIWVSPYFWIVQVLILAIVVGFVANRRKTARLISDPAYAKKVRCQNDAHKYLKKALSSAAKSGAKDFLNFGRSSLQNILAADSEYEPDAMLFGEAQKLLTEKGFDSERIESLKIFFEGSDALEYGGLDISYLDLNKLSQSLKSAVKEIENAKR